MIKQEEEKLVGLLMVTHGNYGDDLIACARHILGYHPKQCAALAVNHSDIRSNFPSIEATISALNMGLGVLILTDMYGATPSNMVGHYLDPGNIEAIAGVNLPMLIKSINYQNQGLEILIQKAITGGREGVVKFEK